VLRESYGFETDVFAIPTENAHLELMMRIGDLIRQHEAHDTLFVIYYGGHARIDESRQSTWCATRHSGSPWLQWSAIQTLLERSISDTLILLDCCAGAASATFPKTKSITETISASSWDAIAPDPGRYSFTNALIEVLGDWRHRVFSAAMLHAEVLARLKHPRPIMINGKHFEARSTPVHFMMTSNHKAPSIEVGRILSPDHMPPSPPQEASTPESEQPVSGRGPFDGPVAEPNEDQPHVMISLALEDNQRLDLNAWEQWLQSFPALAKYVKVQGVFKSHSTLLLLSMPVTIWDLLPEDHACSFIAFIRSNNLIKSPPEPETPLAVSSTQGVRDRDGAEEEDDDDGAGSLFSGTTMTPTERRVSGVLPSSSTTSSIRPAAGGPGHGGNSRTAFHRSITEPLSPQHQSIRSRPSSTFRPPNSPLEPLRRQLTPSSTASYLPHPDSPEPIARIAILNQQRNSRRTIFPTDVEGGIPDGPPLASHVIARLEDYYAQEPSPTAGVTEFFASNLGVEKRDIDLWFQRRQQLQRMHDNLSSLRVTDPSPPPPPTGVRMLLPGHLNSLLDIFPPSQLLLVDLRSPTDFDKGHVHGAVNLRAPVSLLAKRRRGSAGGGGLDLLERAFTDDASRRGFATRRAAARCLVVYDRAVEFGWECPLASELAARLRERGWRGDAYVLKGHYREFSKSFDRYIAGDKMTKAAKTYIDGLRDRATPTQVSSTPWYFFFWGPFSAAKEAHDVARREHGAS
jgi:hypothetical protein